MKSIHATTTTNLEIGNSQIEGRDNDLVLYKTTANTWRCKGTIDKSVIVNAITLTPIEQRALFNELKHLL